MFKEDLKPNEGQIEETEENLGKQDNGSKKIIVDELLIERTNVTKAKEGEQRKRFIKEKTSVNGYLATAANCYEELINKEECVAENTMLVPKSENNKSKTKSNEVQNTNPCTCRPPRDVGGFKLRFAQCTIYTPPTTERRQENNQIKKKNGDREDGDDQHEAPYNLRRKMIMLWVNDRGEGGEAEKIKINKDYLDESNSSNKQSDVKGIIEAKGGKKGGGKGGKKGKKEDAGEGKADSSGGQPSECRTQCNKQCTVRPATTAQCGCATPAAKVEEKPPEDGEDKKGGKKAKGGKGKKKKK